MYRQALGEEAWPDDPGVPCGTWAGIIYIASLYIYIHVACAYHFIVSARSSVSP